MGYKNAAELLPPNLLKDLQEYFSGGIIYVPKTTKKAAWGELSGSRLDIDNRNRNIRRLFKTGVRVQELSEQFYLSEETIKKIVYTKKVG